MANSHQMYNRLNVSTNDAIYREGHFPAYVTLQPRGADGYQSAASNQARLGALPIWRMPAKSAVCSKIGTVALWTDSGEERGREIGSALHHQIQKAQPSLAGLFYCPNHYVT